MEGEGRGNSGAFIENLQVDRRILDLWPARLSLLYLLRPPLRRVLAAAELAEGQGHRAGVGGGGLGLPDGLGELQGTGAVADGAVRAGGEEAGQGVAQQA